MANAEGAAALDPFVYRALDLDALGNFSLNKVIPVAAVFTGVLSTFSTSSNNRLADMQHRKKCLQQTAGVVRLAQLFPQKGWPIPWLLGHAAFHCSLSAAVAHTLDV